MRVAIIFIGVIIAALAASSPGLARAARPGDGVYGKISYSRETDDRDGIQLTLRHGPKGASVDFLMCEGGCDATVTVEASQVGQGLEFDISESFVDLHGRPTSSAKTHYVVVPKGAGILLSATGDRKFSGTYLPWLRRR